MTRIESTKNFLATAIAPSRQGKSGESNVLQGRNEAQRKLRIREMASSAIPHDQIIFHVFGVPTTPPSFERSAESCLMPLREQWERKRKVLLAYVARVLEETSENDD